MDGGNESKNASEPQNCEGSEKPSRRDRIAGWQQDANGQNARKPVKTIPETSKLKSGNSQ